MSDNDADAQLRADCKSLQFWNTRRAEILSGDRFPGLDDLRSGLPFFRGDMRADVRTFLQTEMLNRYTDQDVLPALQLAFDNPTRDTIAAASAAIDSPTGLQRRLDLYAAYLGDAPARDRTVRRAFEGNFTSSFGGQAMTLALGVGFSQVSWRETSIDNVSSGRVTDILEAGTNLLESVGELAVRLAPALKRLDDEDGLEAWLAGGEKPQAKAGIVIDDNIPDEFRGGPEDEPEPAPEPDVPSVVAVPLLDPAKATSHTRDIIRSFAGVAGERLPIAQVKDLAQSASRLAAKWPYARELIHLILMDLVHGGNVVFRPTILVGDPGIGKSALVRAIADELGLPSQTYDLGGQADSSMMGTSSRFSTAEPSAVLNFIKTEKMASVCFIWDEVEKVAEGRANGSALDAMLPFLVSHQAERLRDPCLNVDVNLSYVSHFATANSLHGIPAPLRDRMRIMRMPTPGPEHIGVLTERIIDDLARSRNLQREWYPPMAQDELDNIAKVWRQTRSLRWLERHIETTMRVRDQHLIGRA